MPRRQFTTEERQRGGKTRAAQESFRDARSQGFWVTLDRHPFFARNWLKQQLRASNQAKKES
jgi:hypothetical protein